MMRRVTALDFYLGRMVPIRHRRFLRRGRPRHPVRDDALTDSSACGTAPKKLADELGGIKGLAAAPDNSFYAVSPGS
jgi:hypothetical protein